jgi:hypothetical protein
VTILKAMGLFAIMMGHIGIFIKGDELENYNFYCEQKYS